MSLSLFAAPHADILASTSRLRKLLSPVLDEGAPEKVSLEHLLIVLGPKATGLMIVVLALPGIFGIPGLSSLMSIPIFLLALSFILGQRTPWLPKKLKTYTLSSLALRKAFDKADPFLQKLEHFTKVRQKTVVGPYGRPVLGLMMIVLCGFMALPIPFTDPIMALPMALMAVGISEEDGAVASAGFLGAIVAMGSMVFLWKAVLWCF